MFDYTADSLPLIITLVFQSEVQTASLNNLNHSFVIYTAHLPLDGRSKPFSSCNCDLKYHTSLPTVFYVPSVYSVDKTYVKNAPISLLKNTQWYNSLVFLWSCSSDVLKTESLIPKKVCLFSVLLKSFPQILCQAVPGKSH